MRKVVLLALVSLLLSTAVVVRFVRPVAASLRVHNIDTDLDYATIQEAINAPQTLDGHTIVVDAGTYYEHVVVNKSVTLVGEDSSTTIIDGNGTWMVVQSNTSDVEIRGFTVQNGGYPYSGIQIGGCVNNAIRDCIIRNNVYGIELYESNDSIVVGNKIMNSSWAGIHVKDSNNNDIHDNIIIENSLGVWITSASSTFNKLYHNNFINNLNHVLFFAPTTIWDNGAEGNYWDDYTGEDRDGDGIGDTPYIDVDDEYPLMEPWSLFRTFSVPWNGETYNVTTFCNATVASFKFNQSLMQISFNVTGPSGNMSFCNVTIPNTLLRGEFTVYVDDNSTDFTQVDNATHTSLYFTFEFLSTRKVKIIATQVGSTITVSVDPATVTVGSNVTINGTITPVRVDVNVTISYQLSGETWSTLATVTTDSDSCYTYLWTTTETGTYEIKTSWEGDNNTLPSESEILTIKVSLPPVVFPVTVDGLEFNVVVESNSIVSDFDFRKDEKEISFSVTGPDGTVGFCNVIIPKELLWLESPSDVWVVLIDGETATDLLTTENVTHTFLYFTYTHSLHNIIIRGTGVVPEFLTLIALLLVLAILAVSTIILKRIPLKKPLR